MSTKENLLTEQQGQAMVRLARKTLEKELGPSQEADDESPSEQQTEAIFKVRQGVFVTLKIEGKLRGCIGSLIGHEPIWQGVRTHAINAGFHDPRFPSLTAEELDRVRIEVSVLSEPQLLVYKDSNDLIVRLKPFEDGVILRKGHASATFLPQVWEQLPEPAAFLSNLCLKAGLKADTWRHTPLEVETYQVQYFEEESK